VTRRISLGTLAIMGILLLTPGPTASAQHPALDSETQFQLSGMLRDARDEVRKHYFDPGLHGLDWDARYQEYATRLAKARSLGDGFRIVAAFLSGMKDSHTYFVPPDRANRYNEGYMFSMVGNSCFITQVRPGMDAATKLHAGDQILTYQGYNVNREDFHEMRYFYRVLSPMTESRLEVRSPDGATRTVVVNSAVKEGRRELDLTERENNDFLDLAHRAENEARVSRSVLVEMGDLVVWKLKQFDLDEADIGHGIAIARRHKALLLDLRGNPGGDVESLRSLVGFLFDKEVKIADRMGRKETKPLIAKHYGNPFEGTLVVLVDADSASAAELLARVVQLEHRGTVIGDRTAGAVMEARFYSESLGTNSKIFYGFSVTDANLIMSDGRSIEKTGVSPDEVVLPTAADLAAGRDPVLAHAAEIAGAKLDPAAAGKLFPFEWAVW
jgi:carboxyl-terminal processing protease